MATKFFKILGAFPFLPEDQIDFAWRQIYPLIPADMTFFTDDFERTWIGTSARRPLFSHSKWNHHEDTQLMLPRSSNIAEGWHLGFHSLMSCTNPSIWRFLDRLKKEQTLTDVKITQHMMREPPPLRARKWVLYDEKLKRIVDDFENYELVDYLTAIGNLI